MLHIERPSGRDIVEDKVTLTIRDENALRVATITVETRREHGAFGGDDEVVIKIDRPVGETSRVVFEA